MNNVISSVTQNHCSFVGISVQMQVAGSLKHKKHCVMGYCEDTRTFTISHSLLYWCSEE